jgi:hypothetical protein
MSANAYTSLMSRFKDQSPSEVFAHFGYANGESWETPYESLSRLAKSENWNFQRAEFRRENRNFPILIGYLNYTFLRLQEQGKIMFSADGNRACFNTGLQTPNEKDIFATFFRNRNAEQRNQPDWTLYGFFDSYSDRLADFRPLPEIATYIDDTSDLVFDPKFDIEVNYDHLFEDNKDRLPEVLQNNRMLAISAIQGSIQLLKDKVKRNYKIAIPHWYRGRIQLLMPLNITNEHQADLALVAAKDAGAKLYRIKTVLTMDMAYMDARLITRPDRDWLNP